MILAYLMAGHALADYPLQGDFLARGKNHRNPLPLIPWWQCLLAHSMIHAGFVLLITSSLWLAVAEFAAHNVIDFGKSQGWFGFNVDQFLHVVCKLMWFALWLRFLRP